MADKGSVRRRVTKDDDTQEISSHVRAYDEDDENTTEGNSSNSGFNLLDIFKVILVTLALSAALSWFITGESFLWGWKPWWSQPGAIRSWMVRHLLLFFLMV
jgi:hypothetical protein